MKKRLLLLRMTALLVGLSMAIGASAADVYDFTYNNLQFVITGSTTAKVVGPTMTNPSGSWNVPATATNSSTGITYTITEIGDNAFRDCSAITSMKIAAGVTKIGNYAFRDCTGLTSVTFPATLTTLGYYAFYGCSSLQQVALPDGLTSIGLDAFARSGLKNVVVPNSVTSMGSEAFYCCDQLQYAVLSDHITSINQRVFQGCTSLTGVAIPSSVTYIDASAFKDCPSLSRVVIPQNVTSIEMDAFAGTTALTSVTCLATTPPSLYNSGVFSNTTYNNATLYVQPNSLSAYQSAVGWQNFINISGTASYDYDAALNVSGGTIHFTSSSDYPWSVETEGGRDYAKSGNAGVASSTSTLTATVNVAMASTLSFDFKAWGEGVNTYYDRCIFSIDGTAQFTYGAFDNDWTTYEVDIPAGTHTLTWSYTKDSSVNATGDYFAIDNVGIRVSLNQALNVAGGNINFVSEGDYPWIGVVDGNRVYARSGNMGVASSASNLTATVNVSKSSILSFDFMAWGEGVNTYYDQCIFSIDGTAQFTYGARDNDWETYQVDLAAGTHTLTWSYIKDGSVNPEGDYFAVDNVRIREKTAMRGDVNSDGAVDINDVTKLINYVLTGDATGVDRAAADVDYSTHVDINDVTALINYILSGAWPTPTFTVGGVTFKMIPVSGGTFMMGARDGEESAGSYEKPLHQVTLSSFSIGETEVTQALWLAVMGSNPSYFTGDLNRPVEKVSWNDCQTFITKLNQMTGGNFRLPTEAEWEFAARGGNQSVGYIYAGSDTPDDVAWFNENSGSTTHPVAQKQANELGLYDMSGNVSEWCSDWYDDNYYSVSPSENPTGPESGYQRVSRGGNHGNDAIYIRVAFRNNPTPGTVRDYQGLRLAQ